MDYCLNKNIFHVYSDVMLAAQVNFISKGKILVKVYTKDKELILEEKLNSGEMIIQFYGIHEYIMLEDSIVIETKNGPYFGPEKDRTRVEIG